VALPERAIVRSESIAAIFAAQKNSNQISALKLAVIHRSTLDSLLRPHEGVAPQVKTIATMSYVKPHTLYDYWPSRQMILLLMSCVATCHH